MPGSDIYVVLNVFTHRIVGPFANTTEALDWISNREDMAGLTVLPMDTGERRTDPVERIVSLHMGGSTPSKIQAIKELRASQGLSLVQAKQAVDAEWERQEAKNARR